MNVILLWTLISFHDPITGTDGRIMRTQTITMPIISNIDAPRADLEVCIETGKRIKSEKESNVHHIIYCYDTQSNIYYEVK